MRFVFSLLLFSNFCLVMITCCKSDKDKDHRPRVSCTGMALRDIPSGIDTTTEVIVLTDNEFVSLSWSSYLSFPKLHELDLSRNQVTSLERPPDEALLSLKILHLSENKLQELPDSAFIAAPNLMEIYLSRNQLHTLSEGSFKGLDNLEVVDLSQNHIRVLPQSLLSLMTTKILKNFDLEDNRITVMPDQFFESKPEIPYVFLSKNPWVCSCKVQYLSKWLDDQSHNVYVHTGPTSRANDPESVVCASPSRLKDQVIIDLQEDDYCLPSPGGDLDFTDATTTFNRIPSPSPVFTPPPPVFTPSPPHFTPLPPVFIPSPPHFTPLPPVFTPSTPHFTPPPPVFTPPPSIPTTPFISTTPQIHQTTKLTETQHSTPHHSHHTISIQDQITTTQSTTSKPHIYQTSIPSTSLKPQTSKPAIITVHVTSLQPQTVTSTQTQTSTPTPILTTTSVTPMIDIEPVNLQTNSNVFTTTATPETKPQTTTNPMTTMHIPTSVNLEKRRGERSVVLYCWWLFVGYLCLCVLLGLWLCAASLWILRLYRRVYLPLSRRAQKQRRGQVRLLGYRHAGGSGMDAGRGGEEVVPPPMDGAGGVQATFRSVLFVYKSGEPEEVDKGTGEEEGEGGEDMLKSEEGGIGGSGAARHEPEIKEGTGRAAVGGREKEEVFRKTLYRVISREEEITGWRDVDKSPEPNEGGAKTGEETVRRGWSERKRRASELKTRYSLILREERVEGEEGREGSGEQREHGGNEWVVGEWMWRDRAGEGGGGKTKEEDWWSLMPLIARGASFMPTGADDSVTTNTSTSETVL